MPFPFQLCGLDLTLSKDTVAYTIRWMVISAFGEAEEIFKECDLVSMLVGGRLSVFSTDTLIRHFGFLCVLCGYIFLFTAAVSTAGATNFFANLIPPL